MSRKNKLFYNRDLDCDLQFEYKNNTIKLTYNPSSVKADERMFPLLQKSIKGIATDEENKLFKNLWQTRVKDILLGKEKYNEIVSSQFN